MSTPLEIYMIWQTMMNNWNSYWDASRRQRIEFMRHWLNNVWNPPPYVKSQWNLWLDYMERYYLS
jgi:hypothetical protein